MVTALQKWDSGNSNSPSFMAGNRKLLCRIQNPFSVPPSLANNPYIKTGGFLFITCNSFNYSKKFIWWNSFWRVILKCKLREKYAIKNIIIIVKVKESAFMILSFLREQFKQKKPLYFCVCLPASICCVLGMACCWTRPWCWSGRKSTGNTGGGRHWWPGWLPWKGRCLAPRGGGTVGERGKTIQYTK